VGYEFLDLPDFLDLDEPADDEADRRMAQLEDDRQNWILAKILMQKDGVEQSEIDAADREQKAVEAQIKEMWEMWEAAAAEKAEKAKAAVDTPAVSTAAVTDTPAVDTAAVSTPAVTDTAAVITAAEDQRQCARCGNLFEVIAQVTPHNKKFCSGACRAAAAGFASVDAAKMAKNASRRKKK